MFTARLEFFGDGSSTMQVLTGSMDRFEISQAPSGLKIARLESGIIEVNQSLGLVLTVEMTEGPDPEFLVLSFTTASGPMRITFDPPFAPPLEISGDITNEVHHFVR